MNLQIKFQIEITMEIRNLGDATATVTNSTSVTRWSRQHDTQQAAGQMSIEAEGAA